MVLPEGRTRCDLLIPAPKALTSAFWGIGRTGVAAKLALLMRSNGQRLARVRTANLECYSVRGMMALQPGRPNFHGGRKLYVVRISHDIRICFAPPFSGSSAGDARPYRFGCS